MPVSKQAVKDQLGWVSPAQVMQPSFHILDRIQQVHPTVQITATAVALCAIAQELGLSMRDLIVNAERVLSDAEGPFTAHIQAIRDYARGELTRS